LVSTKDYSVFRLIVSNKLEGQRRQCTFRADNCVPAEVKPIRSYNFEISGVSFTSVTVAAAADPPRAQPVCEQPRVGNMPIGKTPIGKTPIGNAPAPLVIRY
jgi:hypothetical protein